jgi:hypothetical protein
MKAIVVYEEQIAFAKRLAGLTGSDRQFALAPRVSTI